MDLGLKLREARLRRGLSQTTASELSGVGVKTISSFETGSRTEAMKVKQLERLLEVYGVPIDEFFTDRFERQLTVPPSDSIRMEKLFETFDSLRSAVQDALLSKMELIVETAKEIELLNGRHVPYVTESDWEMLTSRN